MKRDQFDMTQADESTFDLVDDETPFFAPVATDLLDSLLGQYSAALANVKRLAELMDGADLGGVVHYFIEGNAGSDQLHRGLYLDKLFRLSGAVGALNSAYWSKALALTDVYALMPQERKSAWNAQMRNPEGVKAKHAGYQIERARDEGRTLPEWESEPLPDFEESTVRGTIAGLLHARTQFMAERVDGIFRNLSGEHVTNAPEAFGKRMIVARILSSYGYTDHDRAGYLHDLRVVIAKFMGRDEPLSFQTTNSLVEHAKHKHGKWVYCDGGALKLRVYKVGTAHVEVHPDMAYRLNQMLAYLHPHAIPAEFRQRPKRKPKAVELIRRPLPFAVLDMIARMKPGRELVPDNFRERTRTVPNTLQFDYGDHDKAVRAEAERVVETLGGVKTGHYYAFEYEPAEVFGELLTTGCIPDGVSHQFYPTPEGIADDAIVAAGIEPSHSCLEPSAGNGALAAKMPAAQTLCIEVSALRCAVLKARGLTAQQADFLEWASGTSQRFDRVVMNPPFSDGRWKAHTEAAAGLVAPGGRLVAVLPASARNAFELQGFVCTWSQVYADQFEGTGVSVAILTADRKA